MTDRMIITPLKTVRRHEERSPRFKVFPLRYFSWLLWPVAAGALYLVLGLPHLRISYTYYEAASGPHYQRCTYWAPWGRHERRPPDGHCPLIGFHHVP